MTSELAPSVEGFDCAALCFVDGTRSHENVRVHLRDTADEFDDDIVVVTPDTFSPGEWLTLCEWDRNELLEYGFGKGDWSDADKQHVINSLLPTGKDAGVHLHSSQGAKQLAILQELQTAGFAYCSDETDHSSSWRITDLGKDALHVSNIHHSSKPLLVPRSSLEPKELL